MSRWIDLNRLLLPADKPEELPSLAALMNVPGTALSWDDVLPSPCVVILGEAGSGKTSELRAHMERLVKSGRDAFFLRVEDLAKDGVRTAVDGDRSALDRWQQTSTEGWFFLDSVDEAKLHGESLRRALKKLEEELSESLSRSHVIVSCRHSDWREEDAAELNQLAQRLIKPKVPEAPEAPPVRRSLPSRWRRPDAQAQEPQAVRILRLASLSRDQIRTYAEQKEGVKDADAFMAALGRADLWGLSGRPQDVEWLAGSWKRRRGFGSLREMIEEDISEKLDDKRDATLHRVPISRDQAREGVERIALALTMCRSDTVAIPGSSSELPADAIDARSLLSNWKDDEIQALLRLAVFDPATYGRVRFHHRTVREYLASSCLCRLRRQNLTATQLSRLLFANVEGRRFARPGYEPIVAWLAIDDAEVRRRALKDAPEHLLDLGDPSELPRETRREVLRSYARRFEGKKRTLHHFDRAGLERFAGEDLAKEIRELLRPNVSDDLRDALLKMIERKAITPLVDAALDVAEEEAIPAFLRSQAVRAVAAAGTAEQHRALARTMIPRFAADRDTASDLLEWARIVIVLADEILKSGETIVMLPACLRMMEEAKQHHIWAWIESKRALEDRPFLRRALFWEGVEKARIKHGNWPRRAHEAWPYSLFSPSSEDADWLEEDALHHAEVCGRLVAFDGLMAALNARRGERGDMDRAERVANARPELQKRFRRAMRPPAPSGDETGLWKLWWQHRRSEFENRRRNEQEREALRQRIPRILDGTDMSNLIHLLSVGCRGGDGDWSPNTTASGRRARGRAHE